MLDVWTAVGFELTTPECTISHKGTPGKICLVSGMAQTFVLQAAYSEVSVSLLKMSFENKRQHVWIRTARNFIGHLLDRLDRQKAVSDELRKESMPNKRKKEPSQTDIAQPRMSKSARIAELNLDTARIPEQPKTVVPGTVDKLILSPHSSRSEKAQISVEGADYGYRDLRIENSLTDEHGDEVKLKKGAHVEITVAAKPCHSGD